MADCNTPVDELFFAGEWFESVWCYFTFDADPAAQVVIPTMMFGVMLASLYVTSQSLLLPIVVSIILAGVIFTVFPASGVSLLLIAVLLLFSTTATLLTWQISRSR